jgi:hypothetical protein
MRRVLRLFTRTAAAVAAVLTLATLAQAQIAPNNTTLSAAITDTSSTSFVVASATGATANTTWAMIDKEMIRVRVVSGTVITGIRGDYGSKASTHASGAVVVFGAAQVFQVDDLSAAGKPTAGSCTSTNELYLPVYNVRNGRRWNCIGSVWVVDNGLAFLPPTACQSAVSGNAAGTQGYTVAGTSNTPVVTAQTSATGTNTHTYVCNLNAAIWGGYTIGLPRQVSLIDVVAAYGVQTTGLGTQVATLASGTVNGSTVFSSIALPAVGTSETASTVAPVRADAGTMVVTPVVASFNVATTTAGGFFTAKFAPATAFQMATDLKAYLFTLTLQAAATSATITNLAGLLVHFAYIPD